MDTVLLVIHLFLALALIGVILLQRSEGGGLGVGSSGGMGSFMSVRGTANLLTRATGILAALFMATSLALSLIHGSHKKAPSLFDQPAATAPAAPAPAAPLVPNSTNPAAPAVPAPGATAPAPAQAPVTTPNAAAPAAPGAPAVPTSR
jgi:preprotein translocase subunit SecG